MRHTQPTTVIIKQMDIYFTLNNESHLQLHCADTAHKHKADKFFGQICAVCVCSTQTSYCGIVVNRKKEENDMGLLSMPAKQQNSKTTKNSDSAEHIRRRIWISYYINNIGQWANGCECENANVLSSFFAHINSFPWPQDPNERQKQTKRNAIERVSCEPCPIPFPVLVVAGWLFFYYSFQAAPRHHWI